MKEIIELNTEKFCDVVKLHQERIFMDGFETGFDYALDHVARAFEMSDPEIAQQIRAKKICIQPSSRL